MKALFDLNEWKIIEHNFDSSKQEAAESIFSIGNGAFGQRANFEEKYSGKSLKGSYVGGIYYPDKTKVGWWKNGYPKYFAKVLNSCNWIGINIEVNEQQLDLAICQVDSFYRELDMYRGILTRKFVCSFNDGKKIEVESVRFCSMDDDEIGAISYSITPVNFSGQVKFTPYLDFNVRNKDSNHNEMFWEERVKKAYDNKGVVCASTKITNFQVAVAMHYSFQKNHDEVNIKADKIEKELYVSNCFEINLEKGSKYTLFKYVSILSNLSDSELSLTDLAILKVNEAKKYGFKKLLCNHEQSWQKIWENADVIIEGDLKAQQAIRFNIFQLYQTYTGKNPKLNIGPKGFTGEKYGGATYWDTEAYCLPFYLKTAPRKVARQLLLYRYQQLDKAIENAEKLGFSAGAALYPMVTMNGEECHNEWEITFEEIHRNGAIAYAIYNYVKHTNDIPFLKEYGREVLIAIARFWSQRVNWSEQKNKFVILGVTGPNEYENNVNNNWYTNYIAKWCLSYALEVDTQILINYKSLLRKGEKQKWQKIISNIYLPKIEGTNIFLQNDNFLDKELIPAASLPEIELPLNQHWSWDRILRSVYIKQADVLQGLYFFESDFDLNTISENVNYYEPFTVHESSLSPCVHSILFSLIKDEKKAYEMYLRTARLDLDDYNNEVSEGLHITSMAGTWLSIVEGFAGVRVKYNELRLNPILPKNWKSYSFNIVHNNQRVYFKVHKKGVSIANNGNDDLVIYLNKKRQLIPSNNQKEILC
ncbi:MAG: family 65 glycosyl hydrolase [Flavobacteriales bacterium]|nr:family 65 glycosyl hydrolase [Flavobacteriales bacterium]